MSQVFKEDGSVPREALPAFDHTSNNMIGRCVLIPAEKYSKFAERDAAERDGFLGWVGKVVAYEKGKKKIKIKIKDDSGYEKLDLKGSSRFALDKLVRLT